MAKILVTGSNGFIGKHLCKALATDHEVVPYDIGKTFVKGPFDGIIHLAAISRVSEAEKDPVACLQANLILTATLLASEPKWFIFASTFEKPTNVYGFSKRAAEDYIKLRASKYIIYRLSNVYGPGMAQDKLLPRLARGDVGKIDDGVLPFEHIPVSVVCEMIRLSIQKFEDSSFNSFTMKLATGIARSPEELLSVATSY